MTRPLAPRELARALLAERFGRPPLGELVPTTTAPALREWTAAEQADHAHTLAEAMGAAGPEGGEAA